MKTLKSCITCFFLLLVMLSNDQDIQEGFFLLETGNYSQAETFFDRVLKDYPNDFEVKLNYGESLLWNKNFSEAKTYYKDLIVKAPESFPALLGFANTLSNLKHYDKALIYDNKALVVFSGNTNALVSKKYIYLGYVYQNQQAQNYDKAEPLLTKNLELFGEDKETY